MNTPAALIDVYKILCDIHVVGINYVVVLATCGITWVREGQ